MDNPEYSRYLLYSVEHESGVEYNKLVVTVPKHLEIRTPVEIKSQIKMLRMAKLLAFGCSQGLLQKDCC